jgi:two-component system phosphate regulon response regulator PhoB
MRITDPWQKKMNRIINFQGAEDNRRDLSGQKTMACPTQGYVFHKSVINLTHNAVVLQTGNFNKTGQCMARRILVVEDEAPIREMVCFVLEQNGFQPVEAEDYDSAVNQLNEPWPDLILLDWMLPGGSGLQFIKHIKREAMTRDIPVMMLTARGEEEDRVRGLETGADDYITKPFSPKELVARIKAVMRRISPMAVEEVIEMQGLSLDPTSHRVMTGENPLDMGPTEFKLLHFFMTHPERVYSREQLLNNVWGTNVYVEDRTVDVHIRRLRKALEHSGHDRMVQTVRGTGYRFSTRF